MTDAFRTLPIRISYTSIPSYSTVCFTPFSFNVPCQFTSILHLSPLIKKKKLLKPRACTPSGSSNRRKQSVGARQSSSTYSSVGIAVSASAKTQLLLESSSAYYITATFMNISTLWCAYSVKMTFQPPPTPTSRDYLYTCV